MVKTDLKTLNLYFKTPFILVLWTTKINFSPKTKRRSLYVIYFWNDNAYIVSRPNLALTSIESVLSSTISKQKLLR